MSGFKSAYTPKTTYGNEIKNYFETNPTPSVAWVREEGKRYRQEFGSDYGLEDENFLTDEYIKYREDNGINTQYKLTYSNPQGAVVSDATAKHLSETIASTPEGSGNETGEASAVSTPEGGGNAPSETPVNATSTEPVTTPASAAASPASASGTGTDTEPLWTGDSFLRQIEENERVMNSKLDETELSEADKAEIKDSVNYGQVIENYNARVGSAENDYARASARFGQNAEYLAQSGLANSGFSDASDNAAYAAKQQAKVDAQTAATAEMNSKNTTLWERVKAAQDEETRKMLEKEDGLLQDIYSMGLTGEEATNYLIENGVDPDRAAGIVRADVESYYNTMVPKAASAYVEYIRKGASPEEARFILEGLYPKSYVDAAIQRATDSGVLDGLNKRPQDELLGEIFDRGLVGDAAIQHLVTEGGLDEATAQAVFNDYYEEAIAGAFNTYIECRRKGMTDAEVRNYLRGLGYSNAWIDAAVQQVTDSGVLDNIEDPNAPSVDELIQNAYTQGLTGDAAISYLTSQGIDESEAKTAFDSFYNSTVSTIATEYGQLLGSGMTGAAARMLLEGKYSKAYVDAAVSKLEEVEEQGRQETVAATIETLEPAFTFLMNGDTAGASGTLKSVLGITDEEWNAAVEGGEIAATIIQKADNINDPSLRSYIYGQATVYNVQKIKKTDFDSIADAQKFIDESARKGILTGADLEAARKAMSDKLNVTACSYDHYSSGSGASTQDRFRVEVNGKNFTIKVGKISNSSYPYSTTWTKCGDSYIGVATIDGKETLVIMQIDGNGEKVCYKAQTGMFNLEMTGIEQPEENEIYNALVNKYRNGTTKFVNDRGSRR